MSQPKIYLAIAHNQYEGQFVYICHARSKAQMKACLIVDTSSASIGPRLEAWAFLVRTGLCWRLQGYYGRTASNLIADGLISQSGQITKKGRDVIADA